MEKTPYLNKIHPLSDFLKTKKQPVFKQDSLTGLAKGFVERSGVPFGSIPLRRETPPTYLGAGRPLRCNVGVLYQLKKNPRLITGILSPEGNRDKLAKGFVEHREIPLRRETPPMFFGTSRPPRCNVGVLYQLKKKSPFTYRDFEPRWKSG